MQVRCTSTWRLNNLYVQSLVNIRAKLECEVNKRKRDESSVIFGKLKVKVMAVGMFQTWDTKHCPKSTWA
jgi:hypothetical protein